MDLAVAEGLSSQRLFADGRFGRGPESAAVGLEGDGLELRELRGATTRVLGFRVNSPDLTVSERSHT